MDDLDNSIEKVIGYFEADYRRTESRGELLVYVGRKTAKAILDLLRELLKNHRWVSVGERLPTYAELKDDRVLVLLENGDIFATRFDECIEGESIFGFWHQNFDPVSLGATDSEWRPLEGVTHWMPIPELPKESR